MTAELRIPERGGARGPRAAEPAQGRVGGGRRARLALGLDLLLAAAVALVSVASTAALGAWTEVGTRVDALAIVLVGVAGVSLALRRRWPEVVLAIATLAASTYLLLGYPYSLVLVSVLVAVYTVARHRPLARSLPAAAAALLVLLLHLLTNDAALPGLIGVLPGSAWVVVPFAVGVSRRTVVQAAERERAERERRHLDEERLRLAQEVHDVVGHGLAAMQLQADIALHLLDAKPEQAQVALETISRTSAEAISDLRATLGVLRRADDDPRAATPGLARLDALCQRLRDTGVAVELSVSGERRPVPPAADVAAYRVVQESLTNVLRHGSGRRAEVAVRYLDDAVALRITNPAVPMSAASGGSRSNGDLRGLHPHEDDAGLGIPGMRRRVDALGGEFTAGGDSATGTFVVTARVPLGSAAPAATPSRTTTSPGNSVLPDAQDGQAAP